MTDTLTIAQGDKTVSLASMSAEINVSTGRLLPMKKWAAVRGYDLAVKETRKTANAEYARRKGEFSRQVKSAAALLATNPDLNAVKLKPAINKAGDLVGYDVGFRTPSKTEQKKAAPKAELVAAQAALETAKAETEKLRAALTAAGIDPDTMQPIATV